MAEDLAARRRLDGAAVPALLDRADIDRLIPRRDVERRGSAVRGVDWLDRLPPRSGRTSTAWPPRWLCRRRRDELASNRRSTRERSWCGARRTRYRVLRHRGQPRG